MPTGVEVVETGEKFEDNALPWDSVDAATYVKSGDLKPSEPELIKDHQDRIAKNAGFSTSSAILPASMPIKTNVTLFLSISPTAKKRIVKMMLGDWNASMRV